MPGAAELEAVFNRALQAVEDGQRRLAELAGEIRREHERVRQALEQVQKETLRCIEQADELEARSRVARYELFRVSRDYQRSTESDVRRAYEEAERLQILLGEVRERERSLRARRAELERSLSRLAQLLEQAETLESNMKAALEALRGNVSVLHRQLWEWQARYEMGRRVIQAQEKERGHLARELHDGAAQGLASIAVELELCDRLLDNGLETVRRQLVRVRGLVKETLADMRRVIFNLRPVMLDELGLVAAVRRYADQLNSLGPPRVEVTLHGPERRFDPALEIAAFRVIQEAVHNARRHARASRITVHLESGSGFLHVTVRDDGRGFDPEQVQRQPQAGHLGLVGMRERVELLGGRFSIHSAPDMGTRVSARFTVPDEPPGGSEG